MTKFTCLKDKVQLPLPHTLSEDAVVCDECGTRHQAYIFPAILQSPGNAVAAEKVIQDQDASCYYHSHLKASAICDISGRFICDLCKTEWDGQTISVSALAEMKQSEKDDKLRDSAILYDSIALSLAVIPLIVWPLTLFGAPAALYCSIRHIKRGDKGVIKRSRWRYIVAMILSTLELLGWGVAAFFIYQDLGAG